MNGLDDSYQDGKASLSKAPPGQYWDNMLQYTSVGGLSDLKQSLWDHSKGRVNRMNTRPSLHKMPPC